MPEYLKGPETQPGVPSSFTDSAVQLRALDFPATFARTQADAARMLAYAEARRLLDVKKHHEELRRHQPGARPSPEQYFIPLDFGGMFGRLMRHYVFGRDFRLRGTTSGGEQTLDALTSGMRLPSKFRQGAEFAAEYGDAVFKVAVEDREDPASGKMQPVPVLKFVPPWYYFPEVDPFDSERVTKVTLAWVMPRTEEMGKAAGMDLVLREIHTPGLTEWKLNDWNGKKLGSERSLADLRAVMQDPDFVASQDTGMNVIPVVHVGFAKRAGEHFGNSELLRIAKPMLALENRLAQLDEVLEKNARPKLVVGPGVLDETGKANLADFDIIEVDPSIMERSVEPKYLTWDAQVQAIRTEIEKLEEYLFMTTETSPASFGLERDGSQVESARALKFKSHRTVNKVNDFRDEWTPAIQQIVSLSIRMTNIERRESETANLKGTGVRILWGDAIVEDESQKAEDFTKLRTAGLISRLRAVQDLFNLTQAEAEAEVTEILQDQVDEAAAMQVSGRPAPEDEILGAEAGSAAPPQPGEAPPEGITPADEA